MSSEYSYRQKRARAQAWSDQHSQRDTSKYDKGGVHKSPEAFGDYYRTFVGVNGSLQLRDRHRNKAASRLVSKYYSKYGKLYGMTSQDIKYRYKMGNLEILEATDTEDE